MTKLTSLSNVFSGPTDPVLSGLARRAKVIARLDRAIADHLGQPLAGHCRAGAVLRGSILLYVDSPAWAAKLRYCLPQLLGRLRELPGLGELQAASIKVIPAARQVSTAATPPSMSREAAAVLAHAAECTEEPALRDALIRLARHGR